MTLHPIHIDDPQPPVDGASATGVWNRADGGVRIAVWKAAPGRYASAARPYSETFVVLAGEATATVGDDAPRPIATGSIMHIPAGVPVAFDVTRPFAKFTTAVAG